MALDGELILDTAEVFEPLLDDDLRYVAAYGGRGSGKSHFFAEKLVERALYSTSTRAVCVRETQKSLAHSSKQLLEDKIDRMGMARRFKVTDEMIEVREKAGSSNIDGHIIFQGMKNHTAESIKSLEGYDVCWIEEAQMISSRSLKLLRPTFRKKGSQIWACWNPNFATDPIDVFLRGKVIPPRSKVIRVNYYDNPFFPEELREEMEFDRSRDTENYRHVWLGEYQQNSSARVFKNWRIGEPDEFVTNDKTRFYHGADWGFSVDPSVGVRCYVDGRKLFIDREVYKVGCEVQFLPFLLAGTSDAQLATVRGNSVAFSDLQGRGIEYGGIDTIRKWPLIGDTARPDTIKYLQQHGFPLCRAAKKGAGSLEDGIEFLRSYDIVVHPDCIHTIDELTLYSYKVDPLTNEVTRVLEDKKNHVIDACRYAVEPLRRAKMGMF
jgi:phage terminase large subunit